MSDNCFFLLIGKRKIPKDGQYVEQGIVGDEDEEETRRKKEIANKLEAEKKAKEALEAKQKQKEEIHQKITHGLF